MALSWLVITSILVVIFIIFPVTFYFLFSVNIPSLSLSNARVLITGGSQGIGFETAKYCVSQGASVILLARTQSKLDKSESDLSKLIIKPKYPNQIVATVAADVSNYEELSERIDNCLKELKWSNLDVLICNAGVEYVGKLINTPYNQQKRIMNINYFGCVNAVYSCYKYLKKPFGNSASSGSNGIDGTQSDKKYSRIIVVSSTLGLIGMMCYSAYSASKFALRGFVDSIRNEFASNGVYLGIVYPADTNTEQYKREKSIYDIPNDVREISADAGLWSASQVGQDIAKIIENGKYTNPWGIDGFMLQNLHVGMNPVNSLLETYVQIFLIGIFRTIAMTYGKDWFGIGLKCMKDDDDIAGKTTTNGNSQQGDKKEK